MTLKNLLRCRAMAGLLLAAPLPLGAATKPPNAHLNVVSAPVTTRARLVATPVPIGDNSVTIGMSAADTADALHRINDAHPMPVGDLGAFMARREYAFSQHEGAWWAPNRAHDLRTRITDEGARLTARTSASWTFEMRLAATGREGSMANAAKPSIDSSARLELRRPGLTEWYVNDDRGLEQGFTLLQPPTGDRKAPVVLRLALSGGLTAERIDAASARLVDGSGLEVLRYQDLLVNDATGRRLDASLAVDAGSLGIRFSDAGATYPVTVDPLVTTPSVTVTGTQLGEALGTSVASAGDIDADGLDDIVVGAPRFDTGAFVDAGEALVALGQPGALVLPLYVFDGGQSDERLGTSVSSGGDIDANGFADVLIGAPGWDNLGAAPPIIDGGRAYLLHSDPVPPHLPTLPITIVQSGAQPLGAGMGESRGGAVARIGHHDGDLRDDVIVGRPGLDQSAVNIDAGGFTVYRGQAAFPFITGAVGMAYAFTVAQPGAHVGAAVGSGDVDGDGFRDALAGAPDLDAGTFVDEGAWSIYHGAAVVVTGGGAYNSLANGFWTLGFNEAFMHQGGAIDGGDFNGDGFGDYLVGAPGSDLNALDSGLAFDIYGPDTIPGPPPGTPTSPGTQAFLYGIAEAGASYGASISANGNADCDHFADALIGIPLHDETAGGNEGAAIRLRGAATAETTGLVGPDFAVAGAQNSERLGTSVAWAGDIDNNGFDDALVGAPFAAPGGAALVFPGDDNCDDLDACTDDACDPVLGCQHAPHDCNDNDACTIDSCDSELGCQHAPVDCDDNDACTTDSCDSELGCQHAAVNCDDNDACTTDSCDSALGCQHAAVNCDDNDACTTDSCDSALGCQHAAVNCDDNDACTTDSCDSALGCQHAAVNCDDSDACTTDSCDRVLGCQHAAVNCDDNDACTTDSCDRVLGCQHAAVNCDDGDRCTIDSCDPTTGCVHAPDPACNNPCPCEGPEGPSGPPWKNHGAYVTCVVRMVHDLRASGAITGAQGGALVSAAGRSDCGKK